MRKEEIIRILEDLVEEKIIYLKDFIADKEYGLAIGYCEELLALLEILYNYPILKEEEKDEESKCNQGS